MTLSQTTVDHMLEHLKEEMFRARTQHNPMQSIHEGYAVILEELDELWDEIKMKEPDSRAMAKEALQVAAMAMCFIIEVAGK